MVSDRLQPTLLSSTSNTSLPKHRTLERARRSAERARLRVAEIPIVNDTAPARQGLDRAPWESVLTAARARLTRAPEHGAHRNRHEKPRTDSDARRWRALLPRSARLPADPFEEGRSDNQGGSVLPARARQGQQDPLGAALHRRRRRARARARAARRDPRAGRRPIAVPRGLAAASATAHSRTPADSYPPPR